MLVYREINGTEFAVDINKSNSLLCENDIAEKIDGDIYSFVEYLYDQQKKYTPMVATWELTNRCNFNCKFCYINTSKKKDFVISFHKAKEIIDYLVEQGLLIVYLSGGEIFTVPDFVEIYTYLKQKGVYVVLLTNIALLNQELIELFKKYPPLRITISLYAKLNSEEQFENVTGIGNHVNNIVYDNIGKLLEAGINVTCQTPVNALTVNDVKAIADWCYNKGIRYTYSNEMTDSYYGEDRQKYKICEQTYEELKQQINVIEKETIRDKDAEFVFGEKKHFDCISGKHTFVIGSNLRLRPCFNIFEGDVPAFDATGSIADAMEQMKKYISDKKREKIEHCKGCAAASICTECIYTQKNHKGSLKEYMGTACEKNKKRMNELKMAN